MAPKKKRTKEEIEAEKKRLAEEARLAEEERLRQDEEARRVAEQLEQRRQQLLQDFDAAKNSRLQTERDDLAPILQQLQHDRDAAAQQQEAAKDWQSLSCSPLPDPRRRPGMNEFFASLSESSNERLSDTMRECEECIRVAKHCLLLAAQETMTASAAAGLAVLACGSAAGDRKPAESQDADAAGVAGCTGNDAAATLLAKAQAATAASDVKVTQCHADVQQLYQHVKQKMDTATAHMLHCADEYADEKGDVLLTAQQGPLQWALWVNMHKNPRFKLVDFRGLGITVEIPKQLALASVALRVQRLPYDDTHYKAAVAAAGVLATAESGQVPPCCLQPLGGVLQVDLLGLSAPAQQSRGWTVRQVTPLSSCVSVVPYPIPPAGADLATWQPDEEPPPLTFSIELPRQLLVPANVRVGWWDGNKGTWSEAGVSGGSYDSSSGRLTFSTVHLGCLALLQDTAAAVPYRSWNIRPTGLGEAKAIITIKVQSPSSSCNSEGPGRDNGNSGGGSTTDIMLEVGKGTLTLVGPALPQLAHMLGQPMEPWQLMAACAECGLLLTPGSGEARVAGVQEKDAAMEGSMCADLAMACGTFLVASSRWNRAAGAGAALVRLSEVTDWEEGGRTGPQHAARIFQREVPDGERRVLVARRQSVQGAMWVDGADNRAEPPPLHDFTNVGGVLAASKEPYGHLHASLLHLLAGPHAEVADQPRAQALAATAPGLEQVRSTDPVFSGTMQEVLQALRLFTFG